MSDEPLPTEVGDGVKKNHDDTAAKEQQPPAPVVPVVNPVEPTPDAKRSDTPDNNAESKEDRPDQPPVVVVRHSGFCERIFSGLTTLATLVLGFYAYDANRLARIAAESAESADARAERFAIAAETTAKSTTDAAGAAKISSDSAAQTALGVGDTAESLATAVDQTRQANVIAKQAADAATATADWTSFAAEKELRAYISVLGTRLVFDRAAQLATATIVLKNTGNSFGHKVAASGRLVCVPRDALVLTPFKQFDPPSIGPEGEFEVDIESPCAGTELSKMKCWIEGRIDYIDEFKRPRYTNFKFVGGRYIAGTETEFEMLYANDGNDAG